MKQHIACSSLYSDGEFYVIYGAGEKDWTLGDRQEAHERYPGELFLQHMVTRCLSSLA